MALDLLGISNENEFYTDLYLAEVLEKDLKVKTESWEHAGDGAPIPPKLLESLSRAYGTLVDELSRSREVVTRIELQRAFFTQFFSALGFDPVFEALELDDGILVPILSEARKPNGISALWVVETVVAPDDPADPLEAQLLAEQLTGATTDDSVGELIDAIFATNEPPRWLLVFSHQQIVLVDRTKWPQKRVLRFDLREIYGRRSATTFRAMAALLSKESLVPDDGLCLLDTLDENSHKHAFAVSEDLKYTVREAVEALGNEALWYLREVRREGVFGKELAEPLTRECLRYLYRLLFLFYVEARPELGYAPTKSDEYRTGYSLEMMRDLAEVRFTSEESKSGYFFHESITRLFKLIFEGFNPSQFVLGGGTERHTFRMEPLQSKLFDPEFTPTLDRVRFRNQVWQKVVESLSLTRKGHGKRRGRISYAQLGINQLGAVYEGLLSFTGSFAETDLYEVKKAGSDFNELEPAWFVKAEDLPKYTDEEKLFDGEPRYYPKGTFIYRLSGRNREKSASYYTPEVLTRCVVKYALKELLKDKTADDILDLTVCEPALGSGAFGNEAVNQLADAYLERKQKETGRTIAQKDYAVEKQKVKAYIADNNIYGVDLNPTAVELAEVSIWLNTMYAGHTIPWFGNQLAVGNSLIGARREVFVPKKVKGGWGCDGVPERIPFSQPRPPQSIYHFLVSDGGMANYKDPVVTALAPEKVARIKAWRKEISRPLGESDLKTLRRLSDAIDRLWERHAQERYSFWKQTRTPVPVFGKEDDLSFQPPERSLTTREKESLYRDRFIAEGTGQSSPYRRLKLAMDYWCSLWFWPIADAELLPTREEMLLDLSLVLEGTSQGIQLIGGPEQPDLFIRDAAKQEALTAADPLGFVDVDRLSRDLPRLALVRRTAELHRFNHWELQFADVFQQRSGFDLILGNPPWIKVEWSPGAMLGDADPQYSIRDHSAPDLARVAKELLPHNDPMRKVYFTEYEGFSALKEFLNAEQNFGILKGSQSNLYKAFIVRAWSIGSQGGQVGLLHPEGVFDDPKGRQLRREAYSRLSSHFQFQNELGLFSEVHNEVTFSINVYRTRPQESARFAHIANLFAVATVDGCFEHDGHGLCAGIKNDHDEWSTIAHRSRIIECDLAILALFARLFDDPETPPLEARLPTIHSSELVSVLRRLADAPHRIGDLGDRVYSTEMWHETGAVKDGTIRRRTSFPESPDKAILSGPHFFVANPLFKTPRAECDSNRDYDNLDLTDLPPAYMARSNYEPACDEATYRSRLPRVSWGEHARVTSFYRLVNREMVGAARERTLTATLIPPNVGHVNTVFALAFEDERRLLDALAVSIALPADFRVKVTGASHVNQNVMYQLPIPPVDSARAELLRNRSLLLVALNSLYAELWSRCWSPKFSMDSWASPDPRLPTSRFTDGESTWSAARPSRTPFERRQLLLEIDVLVAMELGLSLAELILLYRIQFPVLRQYDRDTWFDTVGRMVFTTNKGLSGVGLDRARWERVRSASTGERILDEFEDDTLPGGPRLKRIEYVAPFDCPDREDDYRAIWTEFERRGLGAGGATS